MCCCEIIAKCSALCSEQDRQPHGISGFLNMAVVLISGASGLIGSEAAAFFADKGFDVVGIDNDMRRYLFGEDGSTAWRRDRLEQTLRGYHHAHADIRDEGAMDRLFALYSTDIMLIIHAAAQPSHDWAAREPHHRLHGQCERHADSARDDAAALPECAFHLHLDQQGLRRYAQPAAAGRARNPMGQSTRLTRSHVHGIDETMSIDASMHSVFGASKVAADVMVQEYGRYFGLKTACFRGGCLTGPGHSGAELHGFLSYLVKCAVTGRPYTVFGYKGKQVRDNIHSYDLVNAFWHFFIEPRSGEVYNIGGGPTSNCSMLEAISIVERLTGRPMEWTYNDISRAGDHIWWVSDIRKFTAHYPDWTLTYSLERTIEEIVADMVERATETRDH